MADKRCENGHFIDESWDLCPYCPVDSSEPDIPVVRPASRLNVPEAVSQPSRPALSVVPPPPPITTNSQSGQRISSPPMERTIAVRAAADAAPKRYVVGWLVGLNGASRGESFPLRIGRNVLGRDRRSDVVVPDDQASSHHADLVFRPEERRFILMDHNSTNGTYVNEVEIEPRRDLSTKDVIRIGSHRFLFMPLCHDGFFWDDEGVLQ
ncbi:MAG TPA: FHA domain-containing protein [Thermoanaerobaculia bacterium]|nr:FHA domain-containing protein [Thermoanaerobaculia bacterium]